MTMNTKTTDSLLTRARALRLNGLAGHWPEVASAEWVAPLIQWEEDERTHRSLQRRIRAAKLGDFKALGDFDWQWPKRIDRVAVNELMSLEFVREATNAVFIGHKRRGQIDACAERGPSGAHSGSYGAVQDSWGNARRTCRAR